MASTPDPLALALELADLSRGILRERFGEAREPEIKPDGTPVTSVDREVESVLRERIGHAYPSHGILGEEHGAEALDAEHVWVLDPIDGTKAFLSGKPIFGTLIALVREGRPVLGVIDSPITEERWWGVDGEGAFKDGRPIKVRAPRPLRQTVLCLGSRDCFASDDHAGIDALRRAVCWTNEHLDCYAYGLLAQGSVDLVVENDLSAYDVCALVPVVEGAGGSIARWDGEPVRLDEARSLIAACDASLVDEVAPLLR